ncbi:MAG: retropepsin-like aspartic protease family protein [Stellaceae bacterium]
MIGWAWRQAVLWGALAWVCFAALHHLPAYLAADAGKPPARVAAAATPADTRRRDAMVFPADASGHIVVAAEVDGAPVRLLLDTGASVLTLSLADARAAGIEEDQLVFDRPVATANGITRMAPVTLREVRIGQLSLADVAAAVLPDLRVSLLGMSLLRRLPSYQIRNGTLTIGW